jgi:hypothetical protein
VTIGGEVGPVDRQISVSNCELKSALGIQALDSHGHAESFIFENNRVHGGIVFGGTGGRIIGNDIYGADNGQASETIRASEWKGTNFEIRNNRIHTKAISDWSGKEGALYLPIGVSTVDADGPTVITGNTVSVAGGADDRRGIFLLNENSTVRWILIVENNYFQAESEGYCFVPSDSHASIDTVIMKNNVFLRCKASRGRTEKPATIINWIEDGNISLR